MKTINLKVIKNKNPGIEIQWAKELDNHRKFCRHASFVIDGNEIFCEVNPELNVISAQVSFRLSDGTTINYNFSDPKFIAPENSNYIRFEIKGRGQLNKTLNLEVGNPIKFYTEEEYSKREEKFIIYFIGLLAAVLFSVPHMMRNLKYIVNA